MRPRGLVEGAGEQAAPGPRGQPLAIATSVMSSLPSSLRSMLRWRGLLVVTARTWRATLPSMIRGTSEWPRSPRTSRSRPQRSESAWRSATTSVAWSAAASGVGGWGPRPSQRVQPPFGAAHEPATDRTRRQRPGRGHARCHTRRDGGEPRGPTPPHPPRTFVGPNPHRVRVGRAEVLGRPVVVLQPVAVLGEVRGVVLPARPVLVEPRLAVDRDDVTARPVVREVERHLGVRLEIRVPDGARLRVHEDLAGVGLPQEPDGHRLRLPIGGNGREPGDPVGRQSFQRSRADLRRGVDGHRALLVVGRDGTCRPPRDAGSWTQDAAFSARASSSACVSSSVSNAVRSTGSPVYADACSVNSARVPPAEAPSAPRASPPRPAGRARRTGSGPPAGRSRSGARCRSRVRPSASRRSRANSSNSAWASSADVGSSRTRIRRRA